MSIPDPFAPIQVQGHGYVAAGFALYEVRCRFGVSLSGAVTAFEAAESLSYTFSEFPDYKAETALHVIAPLAMTLDDVGRSVGTRVAAHVLGLLSQGVTFFGCVVRSAWGEYPQHVAHYMPHPERGRDFSQPVPGLLNAPWRLLVGAGAPRRQGRLWWPGFPLSKVNLPTLTLLRSGMSDWAQAGAALHADLQTDGLTWVVANPRLHGSEVWAVTGVDVSASLRSYRRRRVKQLQKAATTVGIPPIPGLPPGVRRL